MIFLANKTLWDLAPENYNLAVAGLPFCHDLKLIIDDILVILILLIVSFSKNIMWLEQ